MKKILIILPNDTMGGAEQYLFQMALFLSSKYYVEVILLKKPRTNFWKKNIDPLRVKLKSFDSESERKGFLHLTKWLINNKNEYEFVMTSHVHLNGAVSLYRRIGLLKCKYHIARESTFIFSRFKGFSLLKFKMFYNFYSSIDLLITQSEQMKNDLVEQLAKKHHPHNIQTIGNLVNTKQIIEKSGYYEPQELNYIVSAGRLIPEKGFDLLIEAFSELHKFDPSLKLVILGEGAEREFLQNKIELLNLGENVILKGFVENPFPYFKKAILCVVSSRVEGFPNVLLQMMTLNNRIVSTLCAGGIEKLENIKTCQINNPEQLFVAMRESLQDDLKDTTVSLKDRSPKEYWNKVISSLNE